MSLGLSIISPKHVVQLPPKSPFPSSSRVVASQLEAIDNSSKRSSVTSASVIYGPLGAEKPSQTVLLCSGRNCLRFPDTSHKRRPSNYVNSDLGGSYYDGQAACGWTWSRMHRPLSVSEYVVSEFGFRRQLLSESLGMTQRQSIRNRTELEKNIATAANRHISACQLPGSVKRSSRAAMGFADLKEVLAAGEAIDGGDTSDWGTCRSNWISGKSSIGESVERSRSTFLSTEKGHQRKRNGPCKGPAFTKHLSATLSSF